MVLKLTFNDSFITFRSTPHLDGKHTVFGQLVGDESFAALSKVEKISIDPASSRPLKPVKLLDVSVFKNPFDEYQEKLSKKLSREAKDRMSSSEKSRLREQRENDRTTWLGGNLGEKGSVGAGMSTAGLGSVGKYLDAASNKRKGTSMSMPAATGEEPTSKKKKTGGFGNFDSW